MALSRCKISDDVLVLIMEVRSGNGHEWYEKETINNAINKQLSCLHCELVKI